MDMTTSPKPKVSKKHPLDNKKRPEPKQERAPFAQKRSRGLNGALALALLSVMTAGLVFATAALKATSREPKRAPCPCICTKA